MIYPDVLKVHVFAVGAWDILEVFIEPEPGDAKRVIGTKGAHIQALRYYVELWGKKHRSSVAVRDLACPRDDSDKYPKFQERADWPKERLTEIVKALADAVLREPVEIECADNSGVTHMVVRHGPDEFGPAIGSLSKILSVLVAAMGKKNGRTIITHVRPENLVAR